MLDVVRGMTRASPGLAAGLAILVIAGGVLPVAITLATGRVIGAIPAAAEAGLASGAGDRLIDALAVFAVLYVLSFVAGSLLQPLGIAVGLKFALFVRESVLEATTAPVGTAHLEDPAVADELALMENAELRQALSRSIVPSLSQLAVVRLAGVGQAIVLFAFAWWAPLVVFGAVLLSHRWLRREVATFLRGNELATSGLRRANYFRELAVGSGAAKEIRVFGLAAWAMDGFARRWREAMGEVWRERGSHRFLIWQLAAASAVAYGLVFYAIGGAALSGRIGLGQVAVYASAAVGMQHMGVVKDFVLP